LGQRAAQQQALFSSRVFQFELRREERDLPAGQGSRRTVPQISEYGEAQVGELEADLMVPSGFQLDFHEAPGAGHIQHPVGEPGFPTSRSRFRNDDAGPIVAPFKLVHQAAGGGCDLPFRDGKIVLPNPARTELRADSGRCFGCAAKEDDAGNRSVQAVHHGEKHFAGFPTALLEPFLAEIEERRLPGPISLNEQARWFIKTEQVIVFVDDRPQRVVKAFCLHSLPRHDIDGRRSVPRRRYASPVPWTGPASA